MILLCFDYSLSYIQYLSLHINVLCDILRLVFFSVISSISISINNTNSILVFLSMSPMPILVPMKSKADQVDMSQCTCCESFQIHLPVIMHRSSRSDHDTLLGFFLSLSPSRLLCMFAVSISNIFHV